MKGAIIAKSLVRQSISTKETKKVLKKCLTNTRWYGKVMNCQQTVLMSAKTDDKRTLIIEQYNQPWRFLKKPDHESDQASEIFSVV